MKWFYCSRGNWNGNKSGGGLHWCLGILEVSARQQGYLAEQSGGVCVYESGLSTALLTCSSSQVMQRIILDFPPPLILLNGDKGRVIGVSYKPDEYWARNKAARDTIQALSPLQLCSINSPPTFFLIFQNCCCAYYEPDYILIKGESKALNASFWNYGGSFETPDACCGHVQTLHLDRSKWT